MKIQYPQELPITHYRSEILKALSKNNIIVVCGETGSGKTTQLPKMALECGCGANGRKIACTQPRRVAATAVAERVAKELETETGKDVGYQHRFDKKISDETKIKFMTDGVLLSETLHDPLLEQYDAIIIDEAHERTLNIDFLLGILKRISTKRKNLKIIISSATLDTEKFSKFFFDAPAVVVPGRLFPVEVSYLLSDDEENMDLPKEVQRAARSLPDDVDTLVFLPGERDIRETLDCLKRDIHLSKSEIIPLYASLPPGEIQRSFKTLSKRRIILATNVAETSLTIPGVKAVIDSGLARISRYIHRTHVQRLQIEPISRASARQRAGRCGRIAPGKCIRLYSEESFNSRDEYTPPEILRSSLAGVILTMLELRLGSIDAFPFIDPPKATSIREGLRELIELGAIARDGRGEETHLTKTGRALAKIPLEPRLARMLIEASKLGTLPNVLPVVAAMSCDNPVKRPLDEKEKADREHAKWRVKDSDFLCTLELWKWWEEKSSALSATQLRKTALASYLSYPKMREWRELVTRLKSLCMRLKLDTQSDNSSPDLLHRSLLPSLLGKIGKFDSEENEFRGAYGIRFQIHPSSVLSKSFKPKKQFSKKPFTKNTQGKTKVPAEWVMAGELVDTSRLFAREVTRIDPSWIEPAAGELVKRSYHSPEWDAQRGFVTAKERVSLHGLLLVDGRRRDFSRIDPEISREIFILHALILGEVRDPPLLLRRNREVIKELEKISEQRRNKDLFDTTRLAAFFDSALPKEINSLHEMRKFLHAATNAEKKALTLNREEWLGGIDLSKGDFPEEISVAGAKFTLKYRNTPDDVENDGITCIAKKSEAKSLSLWRADYLVPGVLPEKVATILNSLPASLRRALPRISETVSLILPIIKESNEPLTTAIRQAVYKRLGIRIQEETISEVKIPAHLTVKFEIRDDATGKTLSSSRILHEALLKAGIANGANVATQTATKHTSWDFGAISKSAEGSAGKWEIKLFKALYDEGDGVSLRLFKTKEEAATEHERGTARLMALEITKQSRREYNAKPLSFTAALFFKRLNYDKTRLSNDILIKAISFAALSNSEPITDEKTFYERLKAKRGEINAEYTSLTSLINSIFEDASAIEQELEDGKLPDDIIDDITSQIAYLVHAGFVARVPYEELHFYPKFFKALKIRIARAKSDKMRDRTKMARFEPYWKQYRDAAVKKTVPVHNRKAFFQYRWLLEEYRISLFAQEVRTNRRVSPEILSRLYLEATNKER